MKKRRYIHSVLFFLITALLGYPGFAQSSSDTAIAQLSDSQSSSLLIPLEQVLSSIEESHHVVFLYDTDLVDGKAVKSTDLAQQSKVLALQLAEILRPFSLTYELEGNRSYVIVPKAEARQVLQGTLRGTVTDESSGDPIPGVNIFLPDL